MALRVLGKKEIAYPDTLVALMALALALRAFGVKEMTPQGFRLFGLFDHAGAYPTQYEPL